MATKQNDLVTKSYLRKYMDRRLEEFREDFKEYMDDRFDEFREEFKEFKNAIIHEMLDIKDAIITELRINRDNEEMHDASHTRINKTLNDHEDRI